MSQVELLREAAKKMRDLAQAATPGPWGVGNGADIVRDLEVTGIGSYTCTSPVAEVYGEHDREEWRQDDADGFDPRADAEHIASWHPAVALAVAHWIDSHARDLESANGDRSQCESPGDVQMALTVARAYLGRQS